MASWTLVGSHIDGAAANDEFGHGVAINDDGTIVACVATHDESSQGTVQVYEYSGGSWSTKGALISDGAAGEQKWAIQLSSDGSRMIVGSRLADVPTTNAGKITMYEFGGTNYAIMGSVITGIASTSGKGRYVDMSDDGSLVITGGDGYDGGAGSNSGYVDVYEWSGSAWGLKGSRLLGAAAGDFFGRSVGISGDGTAIVVGAHRTGADAGSVYVYEWSGSAWVQKGDTITGASSDQIGGYVDINGDGTVIAVQTWAASGAGGPYTKIYEYDGIGDEWDLIGSALVNTDTNTGVRINEVGDVVAIADSAYTSTQGRIRVYKNINSTWTQQGSDITGAAGSQFGNKLDISEYGDYVIGGAPLDDTAASNAGRVSVYYNSDLTPSSGGSAICTGTGTFVVSGSGTLTVQ